MTLAVLYLVYPLQRLNQVLEGAGKSSSKPAASRPSRAATAITVPPGPTSDYNILPLRPPAISLLQPRNRAWNLEAVIYSTVLPNFILKILNLGLRCRVLFCPLPLYLLTLVRVPVKRRVQALGQVGYPILRFCHCLIVQENKACTDYTDKWILHL